MMKKKLGKKYNRAPNLRVRHDGEIQHYPFYLWGKTVVYRIKRKIN